MLKVLNKEKMSFTVGRRNQKINLSNIELTKIEKNELGYSYDGINNINEIDEGIIFVSSRFTVYKVPSKIISIKATQFKNSSIRANISKSKFKELLDKNFYNIRLPELYIVETNSKEWYIMYDRNAILPLTNIFSGSTSYLDSIKESIMIKTNKDLTASKMCTGFALSNLYNTYPSRASRIENFGDFVNTLLSAEPNEDLGFKNERIDQLRVDFHSGDNRNSFYSTMGIFRNYEYGMLGTHIILSILETLSYNDSDYSIDSFINKIMGSRSTRNSVIKEIMEKYFITEEV